MCYNLTQDFLYYTEVLHLSGRRLFGSDRLGPSCKFVENSTKFSCLIIPVIASSTALWFLEL